MYLRDLSKPEWTNNAGKHQESDELPFVSLSWDIFLYSPFLVQSWNVKDP